MTNEELVALIQAGDHVQDNMGQLYQQNKNFIVGIALPFSNAADMDDLMQEAYFGLYKAAQKFDPDLGFKFLTYAEYPIRVSVQRYCQNNGQLKRVPVHVLEQISKYQKFRYDLRAVAGTDPTDEEYCHHLGISKSKLKTLRSYMAGAETTSLDEAIPGTEDYTLADTIADDFNLEESVVDSVGDQQAQAIIWGAVSDLGGKEADIVEGYYKNGETLDNLSNRLEISKERVRQIKHNAIGTLRHNRKLKEAAEVYGYGCAQSYHWGIGRFEETGTSSTEFLAIKRIELEEGQNSNLQKARELNASIPLIADGFRNRNKGYTPHGIKSLEEINKKLEALNKEVEAHKKANQEKLQEKRAVKNNVKTRKPQH